MLFEPRHTAIVIHGAEYFFGGQGITHCPPVRHIKIVFSVISGLFIKKYKEVSSQIRNTAVIQQHTKRAESCVVNDVVMHCSLFQAATLLGQPDAIVDLGNTEVPKDIFTEYVSSLQESTYRQIHNFFLLLQI